MGIGQFPWFLTKMITVAVFGVCHRPCTAPARIDLPLHTGTMWLLYAFIAMISPIALVLARKWMAKGMTRQG